MTGPQELYGLRACTYDRAKMIEDGHLVPASADLLADAEIRHPVAYTAAVFADCVHWADDRPELQDQAGREWDLLWLLRLALRFAQGDRLTFDLLRILPGQHQASRTTLVAVCGPGDHAEPVITVMTPAETWPPTRTGKD